MLLFGNTGRILGTFFEIGPNLSNFTQYGYEWLWIIETDNVSMIFKQFLGVGSPSGWKIGQKLSKNGTCSGY